MSDPFSLDGRTILVTGAASGIGAETARLCASKGAYIHCVDRDDPSEIAAACGGTAHVCDVTNRQAVVELAAKITSIDGLVLAAGIQPYDSWDSDAWLENWNRVMEINTLGMASVSEVFFDRLCKSGGRIVLVGSQSGRNGGTFSAPHYVFSKGGVHAFCRWLARKGTAHNVLVNAVAPGPVETPFIAGQIVPPDALPLGRVCRASEIAAPIAFLLSPAASYITGTVIDINGGMSYN